MNRTTTHVERVGSFLLGLLAVAGLYREYGWWLNSGREVLRTSLVLLALGLFVAVLPGGRSRARAVALWAGALAAMIVALFVTGPGTIWPLVLLLAAGITSVAVCGGAALGIALTGRRR